MKKISEYFNLYKKLSRSKKGKDVKIAILSSFTTKGIKEVLSVMCYEIGVNPKFYISDYNQYAQEILDEKSGFYKFSPNLTIIFIDTKTILGEQSPYSGWVKRKLSESERLIEKIKSNSSSKIIFHNFEVPLSSEFGILESKQRFGIVECVETLNAKLRDVCRNDSQVFVFDYNSFCSKIGKKNIVDQKMYYLADMKLDLQFIPDLCNEYLAYIKPLMSLTKKCIVLDLDNTLWGGIIGEDGLAGIKLGPTAEGRPFWEFQKYLSALFERGVILAINSKNNEDDALEAIRKHPYMVLREKNFAAMRINWNDKATNIKEIANELDIGIDSLVFIDDDKLNRELVKKTHPEVLVVDLPEDPALYLKTISEINDFNTFQITDEDKKKGAMYAQQRKRKELESASSDITEYLKSLGMVVTVSSLNSLNLPRISQLTQKTNQFNMTTRRYMEEDITSLGKNKFMVLSVAVRDKFGDNGITGVAIVERGDKLWRIDNFLLSCRVIGRRVEETLLAYILEEAKKASASKIIGEFIPTQKNSLAAQFYKNNNFKIAEKKDGAEVWEYDLKSDYPYPDFIKLKHEKA